MWVRTQSRKGLIDAICFTTSSCRIYADAIGFEDYVLGTYATEQRAIEVLDEIQKHISGHLLISNSQQNTFLEDTMLFPQSYDKITVLPTVYEMPKD